MFDYIDPNILPMGFFLLICSIVGTLGNVLIILCTVKTKRFRSPCHILICLTCLADILHLLGQFLFSVNLFGNFKSTQSTCYFMMTLPIIGLTITGPLILAMGIDRLIAIKMPITYRCYQDKPTSYLCVQLIFPITYSTFFIFIGASQIDFNPKIQYICDIHIALNGHSFQYFTHSNGFILTLVFLVYLAVFITLKSNKASSKLRAVFRSIAVIVVFLLFGWMTTMIASVVIYASSMDPEKFYVIGMYAGVPVMLATASNILVFYITKSVPQSSRSHNHHWKTFDQSTSQLCEKEITKTAGAESLMHTSSLILRAKELEPFARF